MPNLDLLLGPPGTGKTTRLVREIERFVADHSPESVALVSFTNAAADEAKGRVASVLARDTEDFPHFRTIHSLAFRALKLTRDDIVDRRALVDFAEQTGEELTLAREPGATARTPGDAYLRAVEMAGATGLPVSRVWAEIDEHGPGTSDAACQHFAEAYDRFKQDAGLYDFNDILARYVRNGAPLDVRFAVIDEAQDLTHLQWVVVRRAFRNADRILVAGDDDQAIYAWAGADVDQFLALGAEATSVQSLVDSHRLPDAVHRLAQWQAGRIRRRYDKPFRSRSAPGLLQHHGSLDSVPLDGRDTLVLARNGYLLDAVEERLRQQGISYTRDGRPSVIPSDVTTIKAWLAHVPGETVTGETVKRFCKALGKPVPSVKRHGEESLDAWGIVPNSLPWHVAFEGWSPVRRDYYRTVLAAGRRLSASPTVTLSTIHASKGTQAETVVLLTDVSARTARQAHTDSEHRVFYVGITRAIETLHVVAPTQGQGYSL